MLHPDRVWCLTQVDSCEDLASKLTEYSWTCCTAFALQNYLWLNDSPCAGELEEYAVVKRASPAGPMLYIARVDFEWCSYQATFSTIRQTLRGKLDSQRIAELVSPHLEIPAEHACSHCG